jgi:hypothetical protein
VEVLDLLHDFEQQMSPRTLVPSGPPGTGWLAELAHRLWLARYPVRRWVAEAVAQAEQAEGAYRRLREQLRRLPDTGSAGALRPLRAEFAAFRDACQLLARSLEVFPSDVRVT